MGRLTMRYEGGETNYLKYNGGTITDYHYQHGIDRLAEYEDIGTPQELAELKAENKALKAFKNYFAPMYGSGLEIANYHLNGALEPFDNFYEEAEVEAEKALDRRTINEEL